MNEPTIVTAGDTWTWQESVSGYAPEDGWTLSYALLGNGARITLTSTDNGDGTHLVNKAAADTAPIIPGTYRWQSYVTKGSDRFTVARGEITIRPDFAQSLDEGRSNARQWLDKLEEARLKIASQGGMATVSHNGRSVTYDMGQLLKLIKQARLEVAQEAKAEKQAQGLDTGARVLVRFR